MIKEVIRRLKESAYWGDIAWLASGNALAQAVGVLSMPVLTRLYSPSDFALQSIFLQMVGVALVLITLRYEYFIQLPKEDIDAKKMMGLVLTLGISIFLISTILICIFEDYIIYAINYPNLKVWLRLVPITAVLISFSIAIQNYTQRKGNYKISSLSELANKSAYVSTAFLGYWIFVIPAGLIMSTAVGASFKIIWLLKSWKNRVVIEKWNYYFPSFRDMNTKDRYIGWKYFRLSSSMTASHLLLSCTSIIPTLFIAYRYGDENLGQFALVGSTLYLPSGLIGGAIGQVYYQRAAERWSNGEGFSKLWVNTASRLILIGIPIYSVVAITASWAYPFVFGAVWQDAGRYASLMAFAAFLSFVSSPLDKGCLVVNAWRYLLGWHACRAMSTGLVALFTWFLNFDMYSFIIALVVQMSIMYIIDYIANWYFSSLICKK